MQTKRISSDVFPTALNPVLVDMDVYASKAISLRAKADPQIANLSFGEPVFGPPAHLLDDIAREDLSLNAFLDASKRYENPRGSLALREAIAGWYRDRYGLLLDPEREIMATHGGVEAIALALLVTSAPGDPVIVSDPSYQLYARAVATLDRVPRRLRREPAQHEYANSLADDALFAGAKAFIVNSPENPTGYVASGEDWRRIAEVADKHGTWVIHDEVYDVMHFERPHAPASTFEPLARNAILINSFSKKFGLPGLRIGWMVAPAHVIDQAAKAHDYLYLGVNIQYERIATRVIGDPKRDGWLAQTVADLRARNVAALERLSSDAGYRWTRRPLGAMFLFPDVSGYYERLPAAFRRSGVPIGDEVARFLLEARKVAVVPGSAYGKLGDNHVRLVLCTQQQAFEQALERMRHTA
ncbi:MULTISPECIES: pyridoxal phosphate-dependent aminotransferase [Burkholderia]|uniref:pyridoxal phosphate-dependent aminotransferase n=1 Tax=Burkholderia TaxID=32008 RepID=UPI00075894C5|nr:MULTISPECIES: pyridoxal phosphate-dependent aminotransferase [Burkholderia]AOJ67779.1 aspartate aminotransferase [Burkholderia savannae]AOJ79865.1 aspartate aminotransferase [Burkholderia savannae]AOK46087.1 aspartate aminotransferase [Burkholderia sp. MSMB617WGS]KVG43647.1 aspartate aminotransferase [Burkholderia sp. MSMB0265]KVG88810.1 aspartate aminotransferase [Burkholderia sp. MSMB2040]